MNKNKIAITEIILSIASALLLFIDGMYNWEHWKPVQLETPFVFEHTRLSIKL